MSSCTPRHLLVAAIALGALVFALGRSVAHAEPAATIDPARGTVVHVGDSFLDTGLQQALRRRFLGDRTRYVSAGKARSQLGHWAGGLDLERLYFLHRPALFLITLGANEAAAPPATRVGRVRRIISNLRGTPCVWVSFPSWKGSSDALNRMIRRESAPCRYFDSDAIATTIARRRDGIHPTEAGSAVWADAVYRWLKAERDPAASAFWTLKPVPPGER